MSPGRAGSSPVPGILLFFSALGVLAAPSALGITCCDYCSGYCSNSNRPTCTPLRATHSKTADWRALEGAGRRCNLKGSLLVSPFFWAKGKWLASALEIIAPPPPSPFRSLDEKGDSSPQLTTAPPLLKFFQPDPRNLSRILGPVFFIK